MPTPTQYEAKYRSLQVRAPGNKWLTVDVHKYKNNSNSSTDHDHWTILAKEKLMTPLISKIRDAGKEALHTKKRPKGSKIVLEKTKDDVNPNEYAPGSLYETIDTAPILRTCVGKGSPEDVAYTLWLALRFKMVDPDTASLQKYCDTYLGVDCSGFVTNYLKAQFGDKRDPMQTKSTSFRGPIGNRRKAIEDIRPLDIMAWSATNHVGIIDSVDPNFINAIKGMGGTKFEGLPFVGVESNGGKGLIHINYTVESVNTTTGVFKVHRGYEATGKVWPVYILSYP